LDQVLEHTTILTLSTLTEELNECLDYLVIRPDLRLVELLNAAVFTLLEHLF
jgi:hypothetical protein